MSGLITISAENSYNVKINSTSVKIYIPLQVGDVVSYTYVYNNSQTATPVY
jgi:hypothetical protein